jgi:uncharacterized protein YyaL (SSP411 family)
METYALASLRALARVIERAPTGFGRLLSALDFHLSPVRELAVIWRESPAQAVELLNVVNASYRPNVVVAGAREGDRAGLTPLLSERPTIDGRATAYVCEGFACRAPTTDPEELRRQLDGET